MTDQPPGIVYKDADGHYIVGPLTEEQYRVINDALELSASWVNRETNARIARALKNLIPDPEDIEFRSLKNQPAILFDQLPDPSDVVRESTE